MAAINVKSLSDTGRVKVSKDADNASLGHYPHYLWFSPPNDASSFQDGLMTILGSAHECETRGFECSFIYIFFHHFPSFLLVCKVHSFLLVQRNHDRSVTPDLYCTLIPCGRKRTIYRASQCAGQLGSALGQLPFFSEFRFWREMRTEEDHQVSRRSEIRQQCLGRDRMPRKVEIRNRHVPLYTG